MRETMQSPADSRSAWSGFCRALVTHPLSRPFRRRWARRILVAGFLTVLLAMAVLGWLTERTWPVLLLLIPFAVGSVLLSGSVGGLLDIPMSKLDERQRQQRLTVFSEPYMTGATVGLAGGLVAALAFDQNDGLMMGLLLLAMGVVFMLPSMVMAWRLPDLEDFDG